MKRAALLLLALAGLGRVFAQSPQVSLWHRDGSGYHADGAAGDGPLAVGSLQKPFVAKAWALAHPGAPTPRFTCTRHSDCWLKRGHGELGLARALALSCNAYFRSLAADTPRGTLAATLREAGFQPAPANPDEAIGLAGPRLLRIRPSHLLEALQRLVREPWTEGESVRAEVLLGLRDSALDGTAGQLGHRGYWAKTGTVPAPGGPASRTVGFAVAVDDAGFAVLARRWPGSGAQAAAELDGVLERLRPGGQRRVALPLRASPPVKRTLPRPEGFVTVRLFELFGKVPYAVRNLGTAPVATARGFLGPGAEMKFAPGDRVGPGLLELRSPALGLCRRTEGELRRLSSGAVVAAVPRRVYVEGVLMGELPAHRDELRVELGAAVLRFLSDGPRHRDADVCDATHCAWFMGRGPRLDWRDPRHAVAVEGAETRLSEAEWSAILAASQRPGPHWWTGHCGGRPLSPRSVWGSGGDEARPCDRHAGGSLDWTREWRREEADRAFGGAVSRMAVDTGEGQWKLRVWIDGAPRAFAYDAAHRRLAAVLGWGALPSPADRVEATEDGWRAAGVGRGHRVGLCLGE